MYSYYPGDDIHGDGIARGCWGRVFEFLLNLGESIIGRDHDASRGSSMDAAGR